MARKSWEGGYIRSGKKREAYIIEKWIGGIHFHVSTRCSARRAALEQLARFEADPVHYSPRGAGAGEAPVVLTAKLVLEYAAWMTGAKGVTPEWAYQVTRYLTDWTADLQEDGRGIDLRKMSLQAHVKPALVRRKTSAKHRIESIKGFMAWLRRERGLVRHSEDPTLDLPVPQGSPAQQRRKRAVPIESVHAVMPHLPEEARDVLVLLSGTGWHLSEVRRFAASGQIRPHAPFLGVLETRHKSGDIHHTAIQHQEHLDAARRIRGRGVIPSPFALVRLMRAACDAAGIPHWRMGVMRHTVGTQAVASGASIAEVSRFLGHRSEATTRRFYIDAGQTVAPVPTIRTASVADSVSGPRVIEPPPPQETAHQDEG